MTKSLRTTAMWAAALMLALPSASQAQSAEERLRAQLRATAQQLQDLQGQQAQQSAEKAAAQAERDAAKQELATLRPQLDALRKRAERLESDQGAVRRQAQAQAVAIRETAQKAQEDHQSLTRQAALAQKEAETLKARLDERDGAYQACAAKNRDMYQAGRELLSAYEAFGTADLLALRQPFSGSARVLFDEKTQSFGDRLYQSQLGAGSQPAAQQGQ
ncbi:hypothetical protein [Chromobacterium sp. IIBBL 290-4]|uniref:hypothetical protein n=1 Tax=Chromobacterium sp. IIBBL 290-4 TaxID=2953890 RepID=UPI0020B7D083|nr:hypothetical protein [Chromobacterium sp. IIBBL 290-4]UTH74483.1 hypothetical protein NKT35_23640 [Chromobacterium sp. IIBBL 290-4]